MTKEEKSEPAVTPAPFSTKDQWAIIALKTRDHVPQVIERKMVGSQDVLMYSYAEAAWTDYDAYMRGETFPVSDIRLVEQAMREFKNNLHRFSRT